MDNHIPYSLCFFIIGRVSPVMAALGVHEAHACMRSTHVHAVICYIMYLSASRLRSVRVILNWLFEFLRISFFWKRWCLNN